MDNKLSLCPICFRIHPSDQPVAPQYRKNEIAVFPLFDRDVNFDDIVKIEEPVQSLALNRQIIERGQEADDVALHRRTKFKRLPKCEQAQFQEIGDAYLDGFSAFNKRA